MVSDLLRAIGSDLIEPIDQLGIAAALRNETVQSITTIAPALLTTHAQHIELADEFAAWVPVAGLLVESRGSPHIASNLTITANILKVHWIILVVRLWGL